jgi:hypothetical protein
VLRVGELLIPIVGAMKNDLLAGPYVQADETYVGVQTEEKKGSIALFVGEEVGGRCRSVEKSKSRTFPPRLEIPQEQRDSHFSHRPCRDEQYLIFPFKKK